MRSLLIAYLMGVILLASSSSYAVCNLPLNKSDSIYLDNGDGTVTDNETGLMWVVASSAAVTWDQAFVAVQDANTGPLLLAPYTDWRLPNVKELASLVDKGCASPAINVAKFPATVSGIYWTSSPSGQSADSAMSVDFSTGSITATVKNVASNVRLVRAGY